MRRAHVVERARQRAEREGGRLRERRASSARCRCRTVAGDAARPGGGAMRSLRVPSVSASPVPGLTRCMRVKMLRVVGCCVRTAIGKPLSMRDDRRDRPVAEDRGADAALQPALAFTERQLDDRRDRDLVRHVEQADRVLGVEVVGVLHFGRRRSRRSWSRRTGCPSAGCRCS